MNQFVPISDQQHIGSFIQWIESALLKHGVYTPALLIIIEEAGVPLPVPGDLIVAFMGYQVSKGTASYGLTFAAFFVAVFLGASFLYALSARYGQFLVLKLGKYIHLNEQTLLDVETQFRKHGAWFIIIGRQLPWFRVPITVFAGMSDISYKTFITSVFASEIIWIPLYMYLGKILGPETLTIFHKHPWLSVLYSMVFFFLFTLLIMYFVRQQRRKNPPQIPKE